MASGRKRKGKAKPKAGPGRRGRVPTGNAKAQPTAYARRLRSVAKRVGKAFGRGPVSLATAREVERRRRGLTKTRMFDAWVKGYQATVAAQTGKLPSAAQVKKDPAFWAQVDVVLASEGKRGRKGMRRLTAAERAKRRPGGKYAKALEALGARDQDAKYLVGNSPAATPVVAAPPRPRRPYI